MCNCIDTVPKKYADHKGGEFKGKKITRVEFKHTVMPMTNDMRLLATRIAIPLNIDREDSKRAAQDIMIAAFCPFCGEKYEQVEAEA